MALSSIQQKLLGASDDEVISQVRDAPVDVMGLDLSHLTVPQMHSLIRRLSNEVQARTLKEMDPDALLKHIWENLFTRAGASMPPIIMNGMLLCAGHRVFRTGQNHTCAFVNVNDTWVWEHSDLEHTVIRGMDGKPEGSLMSAALLPVSEGDRVAYLPCTASMGAHKLIKNQAKYYEVKAGELEPSYSYEVNKKSLL